MMQRRVLAMMLVLGSVLMWPAVPALAQEAESTSTSASALELTSPYLGVAVKPGDTATFDLGLSGQTGHEIALGVDQAPDGWQTRIKGGSLVVDRVMVTDSDPRLKLQVDVPADAAEGAYPIRVSATDAGQRASLEFSISVAQDAGGGVSLTTEFPALRGPSDVTFTFSLELSNDTSDEIQFGLQTQGPDGWQIEAKPSGQSRASTVTVASGGSERVSVDVDPPDSTPAGVYPVKVEAAGQGETASIDLGVEITGNYAMTLTTTDQRLNVDVQTGSPTDLPLVVFNDGTAPLTDISFTAAPPRGWDVSFSPESLPGIEPGGSADIVATITPADDAIAGDYRITFRTSVAETNDSIEVRTTVKTSAVWGLVGVGIIVVALAALGLVFRRYGRR